MLILAHMGWTGPEGHASACAAPALLVPRPLMLRARTHEVVQALCPLCSLLDGCDFSYQRVIPCVHGILR